MNKPKRAETIPTLLRTATLVIAPEVLLTETDAEAERGTRKELVGALTVALCTAEVERTEAEVTFPETPLFSAATVALN